MIFSDLDFKSIPYINGTFIDEANLNFDNGYGVTIFKIDDDRYNVNLLRDNTFINANFVDGYKEVFYTKEEVEYIVNNIENL